MGAGEARLQLIPYFYCTVLCADLQRLRFSRRCSSKRRSACSNSEERMPAKATRSATRNKTMPVVRHREASPGEPGWFAMLVYARPQETSAKRASVAARMYKFRPIG